MKAFRPALLVVAVLLCTPALATSTGRTGASGKFGTICNECHSGGTTPTVMMSGPTEMAPGEVAQFTFTINGGAAVRGGFNVATDRSTSILTAGIGQKTVGGELTHTTPKAFATGSVSFAFDLKAPPEGGGTMTVYAAGNSVNFNGSNTGDKAAALTHVVTVADLAVDAGMEVDAGMMEMDAGMMQVDAGTETDAGTTPVDGGHTDPPVDDPPHDHDHEPTGGCNSTGVALAPLLLGAWALHLRRRARREE